MNSEKEQAVIACLEADDEYDDHGDDPARRYPTSDRDI
jgi:hypothetical protein